MWKTNLSVKVTVQLPSTNTDTSCYLQSSAFHLNRFAKFWRYRRLPRGHSQTLLTAGSCRKPFFFLHHSAEVSRPLIQEKTRASFSPSASMFTSLAVTSSSLSTVTRCTLPSLYTAIRMASVVQGKINSSYMKVLTARSVGSSERKSECSGKSNKV